MVIYVPPSFEILTPVNGDEMLRQVERAGRTCYKSEDKIGEDSHLRFAKMIVQNEHFSVIEHVYVSVRFVSNRGFTHELVRHREASYSQESTRYCNYAKGRFGGQVTVIDHAARFKSKKQLDTWRAAMEAAEKAYLALVEAGVSPQVARGVLPIDVKTEIIMTANLREWRHVLELRTSPTAHPDIRELMLALLSEFKALIPVVFDGIGTGEGREREN